MVQRKAAGEIKEATKKILTTRCSNNVEKVKITLIKNEIEWASSRKQKLD
ncbi:hypothetical protein J27TS8_21730 [Robertmurraya siralis]|uniref:Uncharacterized protein n=1 Tax=Robertmurraya siralis TaxID=77777 RepID=A0A920BTI0_9BACI|nr:hypothetical protein J27TS8_21730 [Robertmurraya siralis]